MSRSHFCWANVVISLARAISGGPIWLLHITWVGAILVSQNVFLKQGRRQEGEATRIFLCLNLMSWSILFLLDDSARAFFMRARPEPRRLRRHPAARIELFPLPSPLPLPLPLLLRCLLFLLLLLRILLILFRGMGWG